MSASFKPGDRVEMIFMADDPDPIPAGTRGTLTEVVKLHWHANELQLWVKWDNGRTLSPIVPPDVVKVVTE